MLLSYRFRTYPSRAVEAGLQENLELCRWMYNRLLGELNRVMKEGREIRQVDTRLSSSSSSKRNPS